MTFETVAEGFVSRREPGTATAVAAGSRCALNPRSEILCTFMVQSRLAVNDFVTVLARSADGGITWSEPAPIWPHLSATHSIFCSISRGRGDDLFLYGLCTPIDTPGESFWSDGTQGLKQNSLVWARSTDGGLTWSEPLPVPMDGPGSAEAPGPVTVTRQGRWIVCYAPYNTFDASVSVDKQRVVAAFSDDQGHSWRHTDMMRFAEEKSGGAEAWVIELADGRLLGTCWHVSHDGNAEYPNAYTLSSDGGNTWLPTRSTGIMGQSTALTALPDGRALFIYNQRKHGEVGVWIAVVRPTESGFGIESDQPVWRAEQATLGASSADHTEWSDFAFGEPSAVLLPDGTLLLVLWCVQPSGQGIRFAKLRMKE